MGDGFWRLALRQTAGRGRLGRAWQDGAGNFMGSTIVALQPGDPHAGSLALMAGLAVVAAVAPYVKTPRSAQLKWPNDVMVEGAKLAGILLERQGNSVVVGIGVNLLRAPQLADRRTCALVDFGDPPDLDSFARRLASEFAGQLAIWREVGLAALITRWLTAAHPLGTPLAVSDAASGTIRGSFAGLDDTGALRLAMADGTTRIIHAGDVHLA